MKKQWYKMVLIGGLAGALNGLFGAGGGLVIVPLLTRWVKVEEKHAFATSIAIMLPLSMVSYIMFTQESNSVFSQALPYLLGGVIGGWMSQQWFSKISAVWLHRLFGIILLIGGVKAVFF